MSKLAVHVLIALTLAVFTSTASAYVIRKKIDVRPQTREPQTPQRTKMIRDWTGPAEPATIWR